MEVINETKLYENFLLDILNNQEKPFDETMQKPLKLNIYLALLSLNNNNYQDSFFTEEHRIIDDFLRKVNNLKVKIQLKRKQTEIDKLHKEITSIIKEYPLVIEKYNLESLDIEPIINSQEPDKITELIDKLTKVKIHKLDTKELYDEKRQNLINNIFISNYFIKEDSLYLEHDDYKETVPLSEFYEIFDYLLDIDNYRQDFLNSTINRAHTIIIGNLINLLHDSSLTSITSKDIIPIILTHILSKNISNIDNLNTSNFKISNIKITDLYSFANNNNHENSNQAKWNKIVIPNEYLYPKVIDLIQKGMYYYEENLFTLENIDNKTSDFKISIDLDKIPAFINEIINENTISLQN